MFVKLFRTISANRRILWDISVKQLRAKYSGSILGIWWAILAPLLLATSINFVFSNILGDASSDYVIFVLSGIIPWIFFANSLSESANSFLGDSRLVKQVVFPRELLPMATVNSNFMNFLIGLIFLLPLFVLHKASVITAIPYLILALLLNLIFISGFGLAFSCINIFFRDLSHLLPIALMVWFWITPVFYKIDLLSGLPRKICSFNPVTYFMLLYQSILYRGAAPDFHLFLVVISLSLFSLLAGWTIFSMCKRELMKKI